MSGAAASAIRGIVPPLTTPFDARGALDEEVLRADLRYLIEEAGVHGLAAGHHRHHRR